MAHNIWSDSDWLFHRLAVSHDHPWWSHNSPSCQDCQPVIHLKRFATLLLGLLCPFSLSCILRSWESLWHSAPSVLPQLKAITCKLWPLVTLRRLQTIRPCSDWCAWQYGGTMTQSMCITEWYTVFLQLTYHIYCTLLLWCDPEGIIAHFCI